MTYQLPKHVQLGHIQIKVSELKRSITFYENILGLEVLKIEENLAYLTADGTKPLVILEEIPDALIIPAQQNAGLYHFALLLPSREELGLLLKNMLSYQVSIGSGDHHVSEAFYLSDPDGNGIEVYADRPMSSWLKDENGHYIMTTEAVHAQELLEIVGNREFNKLPEKTKLGHVHFHAHSLQDSAQFYQEVLGFDITMDAKQMGAVFLAANQYHHHIGLNRWAGHLAPKRPKQAVGVQYYSIILPTLNDLEDIKQHLSFNQINFTEYNQTISLKDPNDVTVQLTTP
ncbi:putative catechol-2,3-dioxygenase [Bacillus sp. TS-2]|nr:putative catechol-2,3-dioxygenase [Bacillus sp. TS-2]